MFRKLFTKAVVLAGGLLFGLSVAAQSGDLRVVLIRHAEKPDKGNNLTCQGVNRSMQLVPLLHSRFGLPAAIYVPAFGKSKHARMYQTIAPFAEKYHVAITHSFEVDETADLAKAIRSQKGVVLVVWEHNELAGIARDLGVKDDHLHWRDDDYDSMWIVSFHNGMAVLTRDAEGLHPGKGCPVE